LFRRRVADAIIGGPRRERERAAFLAGIDHEFVGDPIAYTPEAASLVFEFLSGKFSAGSHQRKWPMLRQHRQIARIDLK
jgi:hypothetical protein